jgi:hypothetical protein
VGSLVRYLPSAAYTRLSLAGGVLSILCGFWARFWLPALIPAVLFAAAALLLAYMVTRPPIEVHDSHLQVGRHVIPWESVSHVDEPRSIVPLVLPLILNSERRFTLVYTGGRESGRKLLHQIRRHARFALIHGLPYRQFWDEDLESFRDRCILTDHQWNVLSPDDEDEVERLFQTLRKEGSLHPRGSEEQAS